MRMTIARLAVVSIAALAFVTPVFAQTDAISAAAGDKYVISAKAGGVNFVEGTVGIVRKVGKSGRLLRGDTLEVGDRVSTDADGKAEILLNPGSYLRLAGNTSFEFKTTTLDDLRLKIDSGSAMLEVFAGEDFVVTVIAGTTKYTAIESGVYRVDVKADGSSSFAVWKGKATVGGSAKAELKSGRQATVSGGQVAIAKFDRDDKDELELWSKARAKELAKISTRLKGDALRTSLMRSFLGRGWNMYNSFGLWVYDPFRLNYCFLPFGDGWYSPYGYGFGQSIWYYRLPSVIYAPPAGAPSGGGSVRTDSPVSSGPQTRAAGNRNTVPPFVRMQQGTGGGRAIVDTAARGDASGRSSAPASAPVYIPSPPSVSAPTRVDPVSGSHTSKGKP